MSKQERKKMLVPIQLIFSVIFFFNICFLIRSRERKGCWLSGILRTEEICMRVGIDEYQQLKNIFSQFAWLQLCRSLIIDDDEDGGERVFFFIIFAQQVTSVYCYLWAVYSLCTYCIDSVVEGFFLFFCENQMKSAQTAISRYCFWCFASFSVYSFLCQPSAFSFTIWKWISGFFSLCPLSNICKYTLQNRTYLKRLRLIRFGLSIRCVYGGFSAHRVQCAWGCLLLFSLLRMIDVIHRTCNSPNSYTIYSNSSDIFDSLL